MKRCILAVSPSWPGDTVLAQSLRKHLSALDMVDWLIPFSGPDPEDLIASLSPDVLVKGGDYKPEDIAGYRAVIDNGGQVKTLAYQEGLSSGALARRMRALEDSSL